MTNEGTPIPPMGAPSYALLSILRDVGGFAGKTFTRTSSGWRKSTHIGAAFQGAELITGPASFEALANVLQQVLSDPAAYIVRDTPAGSLAVTGKRSADVFCTRTSPYLPLDLDGVPLCELGMDLHGWQPGADPNMDAQVMDAIRRRYLPPAFADVPALGIWSTSTGWNADGDELYRPARTLSTVGLHLWFVLSEPINGDDVKRWCEYQKLTGSAVIDSKLYQRAQVIFCGAPHIEGNLPTSSAPLLRDAASRMVYLTAPGCEGWHGDERDTLPVDVILSGLPAELPPTEPAQAPPAFPALTMDVDDVLLQRWKGYAETAFKYSVQDIAPLEGERCHAATFSAAKRLAGFAAQGLLDWPEVCAALAEVGRTSGLYRSLAEAFQNPDDVTPDLNRIAAEHRAQARRCRQPASPLLTLYAARSAIKRACMDVLTKSDHASQVTVLKIPPGTGKTTGLLRCLERLAENRLYVYAAPNRAAALEAVRRLREYKKPVRAELWLGRSPGRDDAKLQPYQTWKQPGLQADSTVQTCINADQLGRMSKGYRVMCQKCPFKSQCSEGTDSVFGGYLNAQRQARNLMREGAGVLVITQDMLSPALKLAEKEATFPLAAIIIDEQPKLQGIQMTSSDVYQLQSTDPNMGALASTLTAFLSRASTEAAEHDRAELGQANPAQQAIIKAHGRNITSRYTTDFAALSPAAMRALKGAATAERNGQLSRHVLSMVEALATRPQSITLHSRLGDKPTLKAYRSPPRLPDGVPVIVADATADLHTIKAWSGRALNVHNIRLKPHENIRCVHVTGKTFQRGNISKDKLSTLVGQARRIAGELLPHVINTEKDRREQGLPLQALIVAPMSICEGGNHPEALQPITAMLSARGWSVDVIHWYSTESRGSDKYNGYGCVVTVGAPRLNLGEWGVRERATAFLLNHAPPPDDLSPKSRERARWHAESRAETWQAHGRLRSWTDEQKRPCLHVCIAPDESIPAELTGLPLRQRDNISLNGRPAEAVMPVDALIAELGLQAVRPDLVAAYLNTKGIRITTAQVRAYIGRGGVWQRVRRWRTQIAITGGGSGRPAYAYSLAGVSISRVAQDLETLARLVYGDGAFTLKTLHRDSIRSFEREQTPGRHRRPEAQVQPSSDFHIPPTLSDEGKPPPVKANNADAGIPASVMGRCSDGQSQTPYKTPTDPPPDPDDS